MTDERRTKPTEAVEKQLTAELAELRHQLAEANRRIAELKSLEAKYGRMEVLLQESEAQVLQLDRLAAVGQLASGIAHDFGNFLTTHIFHTELLLDDPRLPSELAPTVETLLNGARRTAQLVRQILDYSRCTTLRAQSIDLVTFVDDIATILRRTIPENIHLITDVSPDEHVVSIDPARMEQVLMNLALNARDAMPEGGELRISLRRLETKPGESLPVIELSLTEMQPMEMPKGAWVCLSVSDTGTGIADDVQARIFEPFFTTKGEEGTGLGLAQVYGIVRQHEGHIGLETQSGRGTTFRVYLPACSGGKAEESPRGMSVAPKGKGEKILFVEDEEKLRQVGQTILESLGYQVLTAANGREALETYKEACAEGLSEIALVVTDIVMPEMGGETLIRELKKMKPCARILAITGYALAHDLEKLKEMGILGTIQKPFEVDALAEAIRQALQAS
ncbi:MAG: response regulator [Anaerolineae bacterium]|nr:response regulator [Anaerolineae bacterium]